MKEILDAIKFWILYKLEIPAPIEDRSINEVQYLRNELDTARNEIKRLTDVFITNRAADNTTQSIPIIEEEPIRSKFIPWPQKRASLEKEDRLRAEELRAEQKASIKELEKELGVKENDATPH